MGSNNNDKQQQQQQQYGGPNPGQSGNDPKGRMQNQIGYQQERYENQQGPAVNAFAQNYGRSSEADYGNYTDIMNNYRDIYSGGGGGSSGSSGGGGGGGGGFSAFTVNPERVGVERAGVERASTRALGPLERGSYRDPFQSYGGFQEFSQTGGYSPQDISNMRARGMAPIRAAYANAERGIGQQRSLQGGYSPNAIAAQVKMAREQGQGMADTATNVEAGIAEARNKGRLAGYGGMADIEGARLGADVDLSKFNAEQANLGQKFDITNETNTSQFNAGEGNKVGMFNAGQGNNMGQFNADLNFRGQTYNADAQARAQAANNAAAESSANRAAQSAAANNRDRLAALTGASNLYGTTPAASQLFGNQLLEGINSGGNFGIGMINAEHLAGQQPGQWEQTMGRANQLIGMGANAAYPWLGGGGQQQQQPRNTSGANPGNLPMGGTYNPFGNSPYGGGMSNPPPYNGGYSNTQPVGGGYEYDPFADQGSYDDGWG